LQTTTTALQILAVERTLHSDRLADEVDILLESVMVSLQQGPLPQRELVARVKDMWPGAGLEEQSILGAALLGVRERLLAEQDSIDGEVGFALVAETGSARQATERADAVLQRTREAVSREFATIGVHLLDDEAEQITSILIDALNAGIREAFAAYEGRVHFRTKSSLIPERFSDEAITTSLAEAGLADEMHDPVRALASAAIDPTSRFGTEIVTQLAIGYILHAFVGRRDQAADIELLGHLSGAQLLIDTPHLLGLSGRTSTADALLQTLRTAVASNLRVIIPSHCMTELNGVLDGAEAGGAVDRFRQALSEGDDPYDLRQSTQDEALQAWMSHNQPGNPCSWEQYRRHVYDMRTTLVGEGFNFMKVPDFREAQVLMNECRYTLYDVLIENPRAGQPVDGPPRTALLHDAATLALAIRAREKERGRKRFWPWAWVLTPDRRMHEAYKRLRPDDEFPLTLSIAQLAAILGSFVMPASARDLAKAAANLMSMETLLQVSTRYPPEAAVGIANSLRLSGYHSEIDLRTAQQISLDDLFDEEGLPGEDVIGRVAGRVSSLRATRRERIAQLESERVNRERDEALASVARIREEAEAAARESSTERRLGKEREAALEAKLKDELEARQRAEKREQDAKTAADRRAAADRRKSLVWTVAGISSAIGILLLLLSERTGLGLGMTVFGVILFFRAEEWVTERMPWRKLIVSATVVLLGIIDFLW
jgi:ElaB/YqjD/DUF883 family membrane-anchored ribosome-binding protein